MYSILEGDFMFFVGYVGGLSYIVISGGVRV